MKRFFTIAIVFCLMALGLVATNAFAIPLAPTGPVKPIADTYVDAGVPDDPNDASLLQVASGGLCTSTNATATTFLRWNVAPWTGMTLDSVQVTLSIALNQAATGLAQFTLFKVADDTWTEGGLTYNTPAPVFDATSDAIETFTVPAADYAGNVVFQSANLVSYVKEQADGDGLASFAVRMTGCPGTGDAGAYVLFFDKENGSETLASAASDAPASPDAITVPNMMISGTTAVTMSTFRAADPAVSWPLVAGVGALAAVLIGALAVARRRAATH